MNFTVAIHSFRLVLFALCALWKGCGHWEASRLNQYSASGFGIAMIRAVIEDCCNSESFEYQERAENYDRVAIWINIMYLGVAETTKPFIPRCITCLANNLRIRWIWQYVLRNPEFELVSSSNSSYTKIRDCSESFIWHPSVDDPVRAWSNASILIKIFSPLFVNIQKCRLSFSTFPLLLVL